MLLAMLSAANAPAQEAPVAAVVSAGLEEPSEEQIRIAYVAALEDINARSVTHLGAADSASLSIVLEDVSKLGCRRLGGATVQYDCRVQRRIRRGGGRSTTDVVQLWLSYEDEHWIAR